jgi:hypothetical protein
MGAQQSKEVHHGLESRTAHASVHEEEESTVVRQDISSPLTGEQPVATHVASTIPASSSSLSLSTLNILGNQNNKHDESLPTPPTPDSDDEDLVTLLRKQRKSHGAKGKGNQVIRRDD